MGSRISAAVLLTVVGVLAVGGCGGAGTSEGRMRFEHIALNVDDSVATAQWYRENLGMKVVYEGGPPANKRFLSDADGNMMFEFYQSALATVPDYAAMHKHELHIAFAVDDVKGVCERLAGAGGQLDGEIEVTPDGDVIAIVRDPRGIALQFVKRARPMLSDK